ncbi:MAG TPA: zinc ribbon domain-containing protein [Blastocatellia bacterium]|nr:zinc ribbon domain-containing protein [Blastocatellia bacterium]
MRKIVAETLTRRDFQKLFKWLSPAVAFAYNQGHYRKGSLSNMIICPNCGASNKEGSTVCRMCAAPMPDAPQFVSNPQGQPSPFPPTIIAADRGRYEAAAAPPEIECRDCHTMNEAGWSFCQQCGSRLPQAAPPPMEPAQTFKTVPTEMPAADQGMQTVVADRPRTEPISPPPSMRTVSEPQPVKPAEAYPDLSTVVTPTPPVIEQKPATPTHPPAMSQPAPPPAPQAEPPRPEPVQPMASPAAGAINCPKCNFANGPGNSFCANCGSVLTVARTIVMASPLAAQRGHLHLVMEGGQQGEVFDLSDDTVVGRTSGDITFPHDGFMSGRHARIERRGTSYVLTDAGSRNGTFIKIKGEVELKPGDMILIGKQLFRFEE